MYKLNINGIEQRKGRQGRMELKVYKDTVTAAQTICDTKLELPVETEILIPDYLPQVFKIVKCFVYPVVLQKQLLAGRLTVEGYLRCIVYYQSEDDASLCQTEQKLPFTKQIELKQGEYSNAVITVDGELEYINCRAVNQRRVDVRGAFVLNVTANAQVQNEIITALSGGGIQQRTTSLTGTHTIGMQEKLMTAEEEISFEQAPEMILSTHCVGNVSEAKLLNGKAIVKGEIETEIIYRAGTDTKLIHETFKVPFNKIVDFDGVDEDCNSFVLVEPTGCTITAGAEESADKNTLSVTALLQVRAYRKLEYLAAIDAFSTSDEIEMQTNEVALEEVLEEFTQQIEVSTSGPLPDEHAEIIDVLATALPVEWLEQENKTVLRGRVMMHLLCKNSLGELDCYDKVCEYTIEKPYDVPIEEFCAQCNVAIVSVAAKREGADVGASALLSIRGLASVFKKHTVLADVQTTGPRIKENGDIALRIYFAQEGEDLFDIAKRYAASPQDIAAANEIQDGVLEADCRLLIPSSL